MYIYFKAEISTILFTTKNQCKKVCYIVCTLEEFINNKYVCFSLILTHKGFYEHLETLCGSPNPTLNSFFQTIRLFIVAFEKTFKKNVENLVD